MKKDPEHLTPDEESIRFISHFYQEGKANTSVAWRKISLAIGKQPAQKQYAFIYRIGIAAAVLAGIIIGINYYRTNLRTDWITVIAQTNKQELTLPDQSTVTLATGSSIRYDRLSFGKKERHIELNGKAFFAVHHHKNIPFRVETPLANIQVLGTQFQVISTTDSTETWVVSGKVRFSTSQQYADLTPNMQAVSRKNGQIQVSLQDNPNVLAWKTNRLVYHNVPLQQVITELEELYQVKLKGIPQQKNLKLTTTFDGMEISDILYIINQTLDTNITIVQL